MSERYNRLFNLPENLYAEGAPVIIAAGALLKDNQTGNVIAQLKLKNIGSKAIKTAKVKLSPLDSVGRPLENNVIHEYLDLNVLRDEDFGSKNAIRFQDASTRAYAAEVIEIGFKDNTIWSSTNQEWTPLEKQDSLEKLYTEKELVRQFQVEYGGSAAFEPKCDRDLWLCFCGAVNHEDETTCHACGSDPNFDLASLKEKCDKRLEKEKEEAERRAAEAAAVQAARSAKEKKTKKLLTILISSAAALIAVVLIVVLVVIPNIRYKNALALGEAGHYEQAIITLTELNDYKDSASQIIRLQNAAKYEEAEALLTSGYYDDAAKAFKALGEYSDSAERVLDTNYAKGNSLLAAGEYGKAISCFTALGEYKDSSERVMAAEYALAEERFANKEYSLAITGFGSLGDYNDSPERVEEVYTAVFELAQDAYSSEDYCTSLQLLTLIPEYHKTSSFLETVQSKTYDVALDLVKRLKWNDAKVLFDSISGFQDADDYSAYLSIKAIRYDDGNIHDLAADYSTIMSISLNNLDLRQELLLLKPMQTLLLMEGNWKNEDKSNTSTVKAVIRGGMMKYDDHADTPLLYRMGNYYEYYGDKDNYNLIKNISGEGFVYSVSRLFSIDNKVHTWGYHYIKR